MALRNYIWKKQYEFHDMAKIPPEVRPPPLNLLTFQMPIIYDNSAKGRIIDI